MLQVEKPKRGGMVVGPPHNADGTPGGGVRLPVQGTGKVIEEEGFEINIPHEIRDLKGTHRFRGKNIDILTKILSLGNYSITDKVEAVQPRDVVICVRSAWKDEPATYSGSIEEILHQINTSNGCKPILVGPTSQISFTIPSKAKNGGAVPPKGIKVREKDWQALDPNSPRWKKKKESIQQLSNNIQRLRLNISRDMQSDDERTALTALVIAIMDRTAERIGNDDSADNGHFGVTGFRKKHITVVGNKVHLEYVGKSGTKHDKSISDVRISKALKKAIRKAPGKFIFETSDGFRVKCDKVNRYLEPFNISAKDLRGYNANKWIIEKLKAAGPPESDNPDKAKKERKKIFNKAVKETAARVGHGSGTLKKHYMVPELPVEYIDNGRIIDMKNIGYFKEGSEIPLYAVPAIEGAAELALLAEGGDTDASIEEKIAKRLQDRQKSKEFKDTGVATYTRKYHAAYDLISYSDLVDIEKDNVTAYKLIEKAKIWPLYNVNELKSQGNTSGAAYLKVKCREFLSSRPLDKKEAREVYVKNIEKLRSGLESIKTALDVKNYLYEFVKLDTFDLGDLSGFKTTYFISSSYKGNLAKYNERQVEEYFNDIFGKKFYNFCTAKSDSSKVIYAEAFLYESYTKSQRDSHIRKRNEIIQEALKRYQDLKDKIEASSGTEDAIKKLISESGIPYYEYRYNKDYVIEFINKYLAFMNTQTPEKIESTLSKTYTVREEDWSWADTDKEKKEAAPKDEDGKPRKPQNIFEKYGIEIPKVLKRTPLEYVKRTGGLEVGDISTKAVLENFGFKNIIYGNYVNDSESKEHTKHILGGMLDLVEICNIDIKDINKLGGLDINIGATGCGPFSGAAACYFPSLKAINLTKKRGDGSLGHEWAHYLDNTLAQGPEKSATNIPYATLNPVKSERITMLFSEYKNWMMNGGTPRKIKVTYYPQKKFMYRIYAETLPAAIEAVQNRYAAYKDYKNFDSKDLIRYYGYLAYKLNDNKPLEVELETRATQFYIGTSAYIPSDYFLNPKEMFARAFEGWLEYKLEKMGRTSNYLVDIKSGMGSLSMVIPQEEWCYPSGSDVIWLNDWFERLFSAIRVDYGIKPFTWGTKERVDEYTDYKDTKNAKVDAGVEVKSDGTVIVEGDIEEFEKGYGFRTETIKDAKGNNRNIQRLLTNPYNQGKGFATGGKQSDIFIFGLKYFTDNKSGYGIADGLTKDLPNIVKSLPDAKLEEAKTEAIEYFKINKESKPKKRMVQDSDHQPELFEEGGAIGMPEGKLTAEKVKEFFEGTLPSKIPAEKKKLNLNEITDSSFNFPFKTLDIKPIPFKVNKMDEPLKNAVGTDDLRPAMMGIFYDPEHKQKVATNAHVLVVIKDESIITKKIVDPNTGKEIDAKYPNYMAVIPTENPVKINLTEGQVDHLLNELNGIARAKRFLQFRSEGKLEARIKQQDLEVYVNPALLMTVIKTLKQYGATGLRIELSTPNRAIVVLDSRNNGNKGLVMPVMYKDDFIYADVLKNPHASVEPKQVSSSHSVPEKESERIPAPKKDRKPRASLHSCAVILGRKGGLASAKARKKMDRGGEIEDTDPHDGSDVSPDSTEYLIDMQLKPLIDAVRNKAIMPDYRDKYSDADILGLIVSKYNRWDGDKIKITCVSAFGDANYHDAAKQVSEFEDGGDISESKPCGCFHSFLKNEKPELVEQLESGNVNSNPALRAQVDEAHKEWQGRKMKEGETIDKKIESLKPGQSINITKTENSEVNAERSGDGKTLRFVRSSPKGFEVIRTTQFIKTIS